MSSNSGRLMYAIASSVALIILVALLIGLATSEPEFKPRPAQSDAGVQMPVLTPLPPPKPVAATPVQLSLPPVTKVDDLFDNRQLIGPTAK